MSETQIKITGSFAAFDEDGNEFDVIEHTIFRKTTTAEMELGDGTGTEPKIYKLANGQTLKQISQTEFEVESNGTLIRRREI